jgi:hypothetical protein
MPVGERRQLVESGRRRNGIEFEMTEIEDKLELVKEGDEWRIFLNWAADVKIPFRLILPMPGSGRRLSKSEVAVQPGDLFEIFSQDQKPRRSADRCSHRPSGRARDVTNFLDFVECGFLRQSRCSREKSRSIPDIY